MLRWKWLRGRFRGVSYAKAENVLTCKRVQLGRVMLWRETMATAYNRLDWLQGCIHALGRLENRLWHASLFRRCT